MLQFDPKEEQLKMYNLSLSADPSVCTVYLTLKIITPYTAITQGTYIYGFTTFKKSVYNLFGF